MIWTLFFPLCVMLPLAWFAKRRLGQLKVALRDTQNRLDATLLDVRHLRELGRLVDNAVGIVTFDAQDFAFAANSIFCHIRQLSQEAMLGSKIEQIIGFSSPDTVNAIKEKFAAKDIWKGEISCTREDKSQYWGYAVFYPQYSVQGTYEGCMGLVIDMTESKQAQVMLDRTRHLTSLGEMAGSIAHEINNPLAVIAIRTEVMMKKVRNNTLDQTQLAAGLEKILSTSMRVSKIINAMRKLSRIESGSTEPQIDSMMRVVKEAVEFVDERAQRTSVKIDVVGLNPEESDQVLTLGFGLQQILINLLTNAIDALETFQDDNKWIRISFSRKPSERILALHVVNSGPCIPPEVAENLMTPFFTTKSVGKGTGLGLSLSSKIAESHGGRLYIDRLSTLTTLILEVPMSEGTSHEQHSA